MCVFDFLNEMKDTNYNFWNLYFNSITFYVEENILSIVMIIFGLERKLKSIYNLWFTNESK